MAAGVKLNRTVKSAVPANAPASVIHLYGLSEIPGPSADLFSDLPGVDGGARVEAVPCGRFLCWISRVPEAEFAENLSENMQNLDWLAAATTRHQQVVSAIAQAADVLPARFGIEFLNDKSLWEHVQSRQAALRADFDRIRGKEEWGVKVFALPLPPPPKRKIRTGKEYLQAKSALVNRGANRGGPEFEDFAKSLQSIACEFAEGGKLAAARRDLQFNKTLLLKRADRKKLEKLVQNYSRKWKNKSRVECTGPWPPFSFVSQPDSSQ
jgi:hypothetical protein